MFNQLPSRIDKDIERLVSHYPYLKQLIEDKDFLKRMAMYVYLTEHNHTADLDEIINFNPMHSKNKDIQEGFNAMRENLKLLAFRNNDENFVLAKKDPERRTFRIIKMHFEKLQQSYENRALFEKALSKDEKHDYLNLHYLLFGLLRIKNGDKENLGPCEKEVYPLIGNIVNEMLSQANPTPAIPDAKEEMSAEVKPNTRGRASSI